MSRHGQNMTSRAAKLLYPGTGPKGCSTRLRFQGLHSILPLKLLLGYVPFQSKSGISQPKRENKQFDKQLRGIIKRCAVLARMAIVRWFHEWHPVPACIEIHLSFDKNCRLPRSQTTKVPDMNQKGGNGPRGRADEVKGVVMSLTKAP